MHACRTLQPPPFCLPHHPKPSIIPVRSPSAKFATAAALKESIFVGEAAERSMDLVNKFMNLVVPPLTLATLFFVLLTLYFLKLFLSLWSSFFPQDLRHKVVLITGASSGIGEHLAYQYAKKGAALALVARREGRPKETADRCMELGSPDALVIPADVSKPDECRRFIETTISHFGRLDNLVNNAGITCACLFEEVTDITNFPQVMVSKAALTNFYETLRIELGREVGITIATPGWTESETSQGKYLTKEGQMQVDLEMRDVQIGLFPVAYAEGCAKAVVEAACRGKRNVTVPAWFRSLYLYRFFAPEVMDLCYRVFYMGRPGREREALSKRVLDATGAKQVINPSAIQGSEIKSD
ncbi:hypothetical protein Taro_014463 [Colocasia esculenta]|uniref:Uncharacterized protein n=1 Tax=Colocasia esculenta TaxID=4460 RepID=A0A843UJG7_COLES|nr:hypothetical protein [Colocasia esculenta]